MLLFTLAATTQISFSIISKKSAVNIEIAVDAACRADFHFLPRNREFLKKVCRCKGLPYTLQERGGAGVEYHFQEFNKPYAPS